MLALHTVLQTRTLGDRPHLKIITEETQFFPKALDTDSHMLHSWKWHLTSLRSYDRTIRDARKQMYAYCDCSYVNKYKNEMLTEPVPK